MAKREGIEIDDLLRRVQDAPLEYSGAGWAEALPGKRKAAQAKRTKLLLPAKMPGVMRVLPSGLGKHGVTGRSIFGLGGGLRLGDEVHRLLEQVQWGGLDRKSKEGVSDEVWKLVEEFCQSEAGREVFAKREGCSLWREKRLEVLDKENRLVAAAVDRALLEEKKGGLLRIYDFKTDQVTDDKEWRERHGPQLKKYAELLAPWWRKRGGGEVRVWIAAIRSRRLIEVLTAP